MIHLAITKSHLLCAQWVKRDGKNILTDPIFSDRCSPVQFAGPKRYSRPALEISDLPDIDVIVIDFVHPHVWI